MKELLSTAEERSSLEKEVVEKSSIIEELNSELKNIKSELEEVASQKASLETENNQNLIQCQALQTELSSFKDGAFQQLLSLKMTFLQLLKAALS
jgi:chromosome segregation ATPase